MEVKKIRFEDDPKLYNPSLSFVAHLSDITSKQQLLSELNIKLKFPNYFGFNWDALFDFLRDFHWIKQKKITLVHDTLPILDYETLKTYISILFESVNDWKNSEEHSFEVVFPYEYKIVIEEMCEK